MEGHGSDGLTVLVAGDGDELDGEGGGVAGKRGRTETGRRGREDHGLGTGRRLLGEGQLPHPIEEIPGTVAIINRGARRTWSTVLDS